MQTETTTAGQPAPQIERVFDENGQTVTEVVAAEVPATAATAPPVATAPAPKFRIGDQEFATQDEALAYANSQVEVADAYRQGLRDAAASAPTAQPGVTPPAAPITPKIDTEKLYTKPDEFLNEFAQKVKSETLHEVQQANGLREQSDAIWREFTDRHPQLASFRREVEGFVGANTADVRVITATKGRPASYDYIATKLKSQFAGYAEALKPKRELPNTVVATTPAAGGSSVTPPTTEKPALSFAEQVRSLRKRRK